MTETEREAARVERRRVIESNKAWQAATDVRRRWLTGFAGRKTAPVGAEAYLARAITQGWTHEAPSTDALTLAGYPAADGEPIWTSAHTQAAALVDALTTATPKRALHIALCVAVAGWEVRTQPHTWRSPDQQTLTTLTCLADWGYPLADIEQQMLTGQ